MKAEIKTDIQIKGFDAFWSGVPIACCPYSHDRQHGKWIQWVHGWCVGHAEHERFIKETASKE